MPSKRELELENEELRAQLAMTGGRTPDVPGCTESCAHGDPLPWRYGLRRGAFR